LRLFKDGNYAGACPFARRFPECVGLGSLSNPEIRYAAILSLLAPFVVKDDIEEGIVNVDLSALVLLNEAQFPKFVHEQIDLREDRADRPTAP
jgi:hypothetical protein